MMSNKLANIFRTEAPFHRQDVGKIVQRNHGACRLMPDAAHGNTVGLVLHQDSTGLVLHQDSVGLLRHAAPGINAAVVAGFAPDRAAHMTVAGWHGDPDQGPFHQGNLAA